MAAITVKASHDQYLLMLKKAGRRQTSQSIQIKPFHTLMLILL
jgi:hypothetical protein